MNDCVPIGPWVFEWKPSFPTINVLIFRIGSFELRIVHPTILQFFVFLQIKKIDEDFSGDDYLVRAKSFSAEP